MYANLVLVLFLLVEITFEFMCVLGNRLQAFLSVTNAPTLVSMMAANR